MNGVQPLLTAEGREESFSVVAVHPAVEKGVGESGAHGNNVEHCEDELVLLQVQDMAVNVHSELEGMEGQPADRKHHYYAHQHLRGFVPSLMVMVTGSSRTDMVLQLTPYTDVGESYDAQRQNVED